MGDRRRVATGLVTIHHLDARRLFQQRARFGHGHLVTRLDRHRFRVAVEHRHTHRGRVHQDAVVAQDLAGLPYQLHLFLGEAVVQEVVDVRDQVEGDLHRETLRIDFLEAQQLAGLLAQFFQRRTAAAGHRLVGGHVDALDAVLAVQRCQRDQHLHGRAVRVGDDAARTVADLVRVDLRHHQRHVIVVTEGRGVVDHHRASGGELRGVFLGHAATGREQGDVHATRVEGGQVLDLDLAAVEFDFAAGRALGSEQAQGGDREIALGQDGQHGLADRTGGADDGDVEAALCIAHGGTLTKTGMGENSRTTAGFGEPPRMDARRFPIVSRFFYPRMRARQGPRRR
ncbi:hypothetical protein D3C73_989080 [compost metagenome]